MNLYIVRHAVAYERDANRWPDDSKRPLTPEGEERFQHTAGGIMRLVPEVEVVLSSPYARAWWTAEILEQKGWPAPVPCEELEPDHPPHKIISVLTRYINVESVAVVGHRPLLHELAAYLLTGDAEGADIQIEKDGAVCLSFDGTPGPGAGSLHWLLTPEVLRGVG